MIGTSRYRDSDFWRLTLCGKLGRICLNGLIAAPCIEAKSDVKLGQNPGSEMPVTWRAFRGIAVLQAYDYLAESLNSFGRD